MELAGKISSQDMQAIAVQKLGFDISEVKTLLAVHREDHRMMKFEILNRWKNRNSRNSKQVTLSLICPMCYGLNDSFKNKPFLN